MRTSLVPKGFPVVDNESLKQQLLANPDALKAFLKTLPKEYKVTSIVSREKKETAPSLKIVEKTDTYGQFSGHHIILSHPKVGRKMISVHSNGRSPKANLIAAEEEASKLRRKYKIPAPEVQN